MIGAENTRSSLQPQDRTSPLRRTGYTNCDNRCHDRRRGRGGIEVGGQNGSETDRTAKCLHNLSPRAAEEDVEAEVGYRFTPTDQELVIDYLGSKSNGKALPCDVVFEREIYGTGNKAPWQIFTENDPWIESSVYVLSKLIKAKGSDKRIARTAGCGSWHGETGPEPIYGQQTVLDDEQTGPDDEQTDPKLIGYKRTLCFRTTDESGAMENGRWIMHEFEQWPKGEYVLCRIKRKYDSKHTKIFPSNVKCTKKSTRRAENVSAAAVSDAAVTVRKPAKRTRREFEQEQKMEAPRTETVPYSRELSEVEKEGNHSRMLSAVMDADLDEQVPTFEQLQSFNLDFDASVPQTLCWLTPTPSSEEFLGAEKQGNYSQMLLDMDADLEERVPILKPKQLQSFSLDFDASVPQTLSWFPPTPSSEEFSEMESQGNYSRMLLDMVADLEEQVPILESEQLPSFDLNFDASDPHTLSGLAPRPFSEEFLEVERQENYSQRLSDMDADFERLVSILQWEPLPSFDLNFDEELVSILQWE
ncbi:hypothetical protein RHSIM_Rhsim11G0116700 [Rhododendron simsii]|uniref:NAC domain-containing protein n=1 Tax=Rhododendron simsii TaxID=118357 RepID=A0A834LBL3_RHOSS|nr:hypothetical protein RHSIM_Rhsim11G0116700 [Rhododendron simsii]